ncbi:MAG: pyridoxal phosphate-dependent aminotransferase [Armatimonadota bacterium]
MTAQTRLSQRDLVLWPTFGEYEVASRLARATYQSARFLPGEAWEDMASFPYLLAIDVRPKVFWWCSPNNPTGMAPQPDAIDRLVRRHPQTLFVLDEAYCDLLSAPQWTPDLLESGNLIVLRSMTKAWGLAGLRLGYALECEALMAVLRAAKPPWNVNACAQAAGMAALSDTNHYACSLALLQEQKVMLITALQAHGWAVAPSAAALFLVYVGDAPAVRHALLTGGCLVRDCTSFGLPEYIRISPRLPEQNQQLLEAFASLTPPGGAA